MAAVTSCKEKEFCCVMLVFRNKASIFRDIVVLFLRVLVNGLRVNFPETSCTKTKYNYHTE